jgi:hypothetical protein
MESGRGDIELSPITALLRSKFPGLCAGEIHQRLQDRLDSIQRLHRRRLLSRPSPGMVRAVWDNQPVARMTRIFVASIDSSLNDEDIKGLLRHHRAWLARVGRRVTLVELNLEDSRVVRIKIPTRGTLDLSHVPTMLLARLMDAAKAEMARRGD